MKKHLKYFVHERAICETSDIGINSRIWAFSHILPNARVGEECNICDHVFIENDVVVGDRVTIKSGVQLWDGIRVGNDVFIGPNATFTNDLFPRSKKYPKKFLITKVEAGASIGANATILPGVTISRYAMIGAGAVVTQNVPPHAVVVGNPARIVNYHSTSDDRKDYLASEFDSTFEQEGVPRRVALKVANCEMWHMPVFNDMRGNLMVTDFTSDLPFRPKRCFYVYDVPSDRVRGEHAHNKCEQFLIAIKGKLSVVVDNGSAREEVRLNSPNVGLYMPAGTWGIQYKFSQDAVLAVYASEAYQPEDYIRDYDDFLENIK